MTRDEAIKLMCEKVDGAMSRFRDFPLILTREEFASDLRLNPVKFERAKYINATLVINTRDRDDEEEGAEYRIGIGAEVRYGEVSEAELNESILDFERRVEEAVAAISSAECAEEAVAELDRVAQEEYEALAKEIDEKAKKMRPLYIIGALAFIVGLIILFILATRA